MFSVFLWALAGLGLFVSVPLASVANPGCPSHPNGNHDIAAISFEGLRHTHPQVVQRQLRHRIGMPFQCDDWLKEQNRLSDLGIFADIGIEITAFPSPDSTRASSPESSSTQGLALTYRFREMPPYVPYVSVAKTDQDGFSAGPAVVALNLFGQAMHLELASRFGGTTEVYGSLSGIEIAAWPLEYDVLLSRIDSYNDPLAFHEESWRFKTDFKQPLFAVGSQGLRQSPWLTIVGYEYFSLRSDQPGITLSGEAHETDRLQRVAVGLAYDARNRRRLPDRGWYVEARVQQSGQGSTAWSGSSGDAAGFSREYLLDMRGYWPVTRRQNLAISFLHRYREGDIPIYDLYRAGGANSLRGFAKDTRLDQSESICFFEDRLTFLPARTLKVWHWGIPLTLQAILGVEWLRSWGKRPFSDADDLVSLYVGVHVLTGGLDRVRVEGGSNITSHHPGFAPHADIGFFDKADAQRFRTR